MNNTTSNDDLMKLEISIINLKHELKKILNNNPNNYFKDKKFLELQKELEKKLIFQEKVDFNKYLLNIDDKYSDINPKSILNKKIFNSLGEKEKKFLKEINYDYINDELLIFSNKPKKSIISKQWKVLRKEVQELNDYEFYKNRNW